MGGALNEEEGEKELSEKVVGTVSPHSDSDLKSVLLGGGYGIWISSGFDRMNRGDPDLVDVLDVDVEVFIVDDPEVVEEQGERAGDVQHGEPGRWVVVFASRSLLDLVLVSREESGGVSLVDEENEEQSRPLRCIIGGSFSLDAEVSTGSSLSKLDGECCSTGMGKGGK
jgi:hypothetical protein